MERTSTGWFKPTRSPRVAILSKMERTSTLTKIMSGDPTAGRNPF
ncbi:MAG: hypothetical protein AAGI38_16810 [Bacteroidota bacterium]